MALRHDSQGFLQGDAIDIGRALTEWTGIRADVRAIRQALLGGRKIGRASSESPSTAPCSRAASRQPASPMPRDNLGRFVRRDSAPSGTGSARAESATPRQAAGRTPTTPAPAGAPGATTSTTAQARADAQRLERNRSNAPNDPARRDASGRFVRSDGTVPGEFGGQSDTENSGALRGFFDRLTDAVSGDSLEQVDPAVKAFREVAQPLAAGYGMLTGNSEEKKKEGWFRRIYSSLSGFRKDESTFNKAANKSLKTIEERPVPEGGSGGGFLGGLAARFLPMLAFLFKGLLLPIAGAIAAWNVGKWIGEKLYAWMDGAGINTIIFDAFDGAKAYISKGWDGAVSAFKAMGEGISKGWDAIASTFRSAYEGLKTIPVIGAAIRSAEKLATKAVEVVAPVVAGAKQGIKDVTAGVKQGYSGESQAGAGRGNINPPMAGGAGPLDTRSTATKAGQWAGGAVKAATGAAKTAKKKVADYWTDAKQYLVGASDQAGVDPGVVAKIANFESGFNSNNAPIARDPSKNKVALFDGRKAISSAHGYGQFLDKTWTGMLNKYGSKYGVDGAGKLTDEQASKFRGDKNTQAAMLAEFTKENIEKGRKYGGKDDDANAYAFHNLGDGDARRLLTGMKANPAMTVREALSQGVSTAKNPDKERARIESVISGNKSLYGNGNISASDAYGRMGKVMREGESFAVEARAAAGAPAVARAAGAPAQTAYATAPRVPAITAPPAIADAPPIINPLGSGGDLKRQISVKLPSKDVGQDVRDRRAAHIMTGGIGGP